VTRKTKLYVLTSPILRSRQTPFADANQDRGFKILVSTLRGCLLIKFAPKILLPFAPRTTAFIPKQMQIPGLSLLSGAPSITPSNATALPEEVRLPSVPLTGGEISASEAAQLAAGPIGDENSTPALSPVTGDVEEPPKQEHIDGTTSELVLPDPLDLALEESSDQSSAESIKGEENESDSEGRY
jgi:hypothetical protein